MNFARLNHVLIPSTKEGRDRLRETRLGRAIRPLGAAYFALSEEGRVVLLLWLVNGAVAVDVRATQFYLLWAGLTGLLVASWVLRRRFALDGVRFRMRAPERVTVGEVIQIAAELTNEGDREHQTLRVRGPLLPWDGRFVAEPPTVPSLAPGAQARAVVKARFSARGEHHLDPFHVAALVPLGLAAGPALFSGGVRFVVVPRIAPVARLRLPASHRYQPGGVALASRTGESMEIIGLRPYRPGDPLRDLHARGWGRRGQPVVREYQQEYFTRIGVVLDTDAEVATEDQLEAAVSLAAGVVAHLTRGEALIDLLVVGDEVHRLTLGRSLGFLDQALDLLAGVRPGGRLDPVALVGRLRPHLDRLSAVVLVSLTWDEARARLAEEIVAHGAGCRVLQVARDATAAAAPPDDRFQRVVLPVDTIRAGKDLAL